ncbi:hypothetical protein [Microcoleus sp.]|uniref:hypothetical protein n=1 Tax=Microcoleus sp. TaxID=44472 RepID=UPI00403E90DA
MGPNIPPPPPPGSLPSPNPIRDGLPTLDEATPLEDRIARSGVPELSDTREIASPEDFRPGGRYWAGGDGVANLPQKNPNQRNQTLETPAQTATGQPIDEKNKNVPVEPLGPSIPTDRETQLAAANTYFALFERFNNAYPDLEMTGPTPVNVPYPPAACSQKLEGKAVFGAVVSPQGLLKAEPQPIGPTGNSILDNAAKTAIINHSLTFAAASTHKLYQLAIEFKYDEKVCSGTPGTPSPAPTRQNPAGPQPPAVAPTGPRPTAQPPSPAPAEEKRPAPSIKPQPAAPPSPPAPKPAAPPSPSPQPKPATEQSPQPGPQPAQESPQPEATPSPAPQVSPEPEATSSPAEETPQPEATPSPAPQVSPEPEATRSPAPAESPSPSPSPAATTEN